MLTKKIIFIATLFSLTNIMTQTYNDSDNYSIKLITGDAVEQFLPFVATQAITTFSQYPYLYCGNYEEEINIRTPFVKFKETAIAIAYYKEAPVGFLTGYKFTVFDSHFIGSINLFRHAGLNPEEYYYFGEIIIIPEHRGNQLSTKLFTVLENYAQNLGYKAACIVTEEHESHPLRPNNYKSLKPLWNFLGYQKTSLIIYSSWQTYQPDGSVIEEEHPLTYWIKEFTHSKV
jgi:GNAT superfamily N-acetyltransferase